MSARFCFASLLSVLALTACGGGGGGGAPSAVRTIPPTSIAGTVAPPASVSSGTVYATPSMRVPSNSSGTWSAVVQSMDYTFDPAAAAAVPAKLKVATLNVKAVDTQTGSFSVTTGAAYPTDSTLGQTASITNTVGGNANTLSTGTGSVVSQGTQGGLPAVLLTNNATASVSGYVLPYSTTLNPAGYVYQTFGSWITTNLATGVFSENYFSAGVISVPGSLPAAGTASYIGKASGSYVDAVTRELYDTVATMNATANFSARSVAFSTTGSAALSVNAAAGTPHSANPGLDMSGTLNYAAGSNTFTGAVSTTNGMTGSATGRFYGPGIVVPTVNQVVGSPPEIGGTFAVMTPGVAAMQGAFGGSGSNPPVVVPIPTVMAGTVTPPVAPQADISPFIRPTVITPPTTANVTWNAVVQTTAYMLDLVAAAVAPSTQKVASLNVMAVDTGAFNTQLVSTGAAYPTDPALGQTTAIMNAVGGISAVNINIATGALASQTTLAGLPAITLTDALTRTSSSYVLPYSATLNPAGYTYQTFGSWQVTGVNGSVGESYFSRGASIVPATLPVAGTATYTGQAAGTYVNSLTNDPSHTSATMNATADFAARTVAFSTTGTTSLSNNAAVGTLPSANAGLNMSGTLSYAAGNNTFTGAVTTGNGMSGNVTGRFYGPGIAVATPSKVVGAPPEIGGTFAVMASGVGAMQGSFGGK